MGRQPSVPEERSAANASPRQRLARFVQRCRERADNAKSALAVHGYLDDLRAGHRDLDAAAMRVR